MEYETRTLFDEEYQLYDAWHEEQLEFCTYDNTNICYKNIKNVHDMKNLIMHAADIIKDLLTFRIYFTPGDLSDEDKRILNNCKTSGEWYIIDYEFIYYWFGAKYSMNVAKHIMAKLH